MKHVADMPTAAPAALVRAKAPGAACGTRKARKLRIIRSAKTRGRTMERGVAGFHQDDEGHWVAELECGHNQHVRHDPPWEQRPWVVSAEGRRSRLGMRLNCVKCDRAEPRDRPPQ